MSTDDATTELARIWLIGGLGEAAQAIDQVKRLSREWQWTPALEAMRSAYRALGSTPPDVSLIAIHNGEHPVQIAAASMQGGAK